MRFLYEDPRPELEQDTKLWVKLLRSTAYLEDREVAKILLKKLWTWRGIGTQLKPTLVGIKLVPLLEPDGLWPGEEYFQLAKKEDMGPYAKEITWLLNRVEGR
jgi:hypothetical protein